MSGYIPNYKVLIDGEATSSKFNSYITSLEVTLKAGNESDSVSIELFNPDGRIELPKEDSEIVVEMGYGNNLVSQGDFVVDDISGDWGDGDTLTITGKAAGNKSLRESKTRSWPETTIKKMVNKIAGEHGYAPAIDDEIGSIMISDEAQSEESDMNLLTRVAKKYGGLFAVKKKRLVMIKRGEGKTATGKAMPVMNFTRENTIGGSWNLKPRAKYGAVKATYKDVDKAQRTEVEVKSGDGPSFTIRTPHKTKDEANAAAQAKADELKRGEGNITFEIEGDETLQPEGVAKASGISEGANGQWSIDSIVQTMSFDEGKNTGFGTAVNGEKGKE